ncbi:MAG: transposase, partial [Candidatus Omnitrophica bacterium]|nr:transposase [Candidatus Omnitrophota bacterium]
NASLETGVDVGAYCLMTNHFHLLLYPRDREGLIGLMKSVCQHYTQYVNRKYGRSGKLWENRYKLNIVEPEYEWVISRYIDQNPVRAGMVNDGEKYEYSSAQAHIKGEFNEILNKDIIGQRRKEYCEFMEEVKESGKEQLNQIRTTIHQEKVIGTRGFVERMSEKFEVSFQIRGRGRPAKQNK